MIKLLILIALSQAVTPGLIGEPPVITKQMQKDSQRYGISAEALAQLYAEPFVVTVPKDQSADAWGRAQTFVAQYSSMKLQTVTDYVIQTFNPPRAGMYGYTITRTPGATADTLAVTGMYWPSLIYRRYRDQAELNARVAARYIRTGILPCNCIER